MKTDDIFYDKDADLGKLDGKTVAILGYGSQGHAHALNLKDSGVDVVVGLRPDSASRAKAEAAGLEVLDIAEAASRGDLVMILLPDEKQGEIWTRRDRRRHRPRQPPALRPRLRDPLRRDRAAARRRRRHGRAQGPGPPGPPPVRGRQRRPLPDGRPPGRHRQRPRPRPRLRLRDRRRPRRGDRDDLQRRVRDRPLRRAGRPLRRRLGAGPGRLRDPGRGRLRPAPRLLRVPARAEADRRPDVREGDPGDALLDLQHRRVRRPHPRQPGDHRRDQGGDEADPHRDPVRRLRPRVHRREQGRQRELRPHARASCKGPRSRRSARTCGR